MKIAAATFALVLFCATAHAHLNHVQFAAIDEVDGKLRIRYRMSADMFMSNLDVEIKNGRLTDAIKQKPIDEIIRDYFKTHLAFEIGGTKREALSATFTLDEKTRDWLADFLFEAPAGGVETTLICDAFLENNPRTQTLASIDWRGEKTMFHFRKENVRYVMGSSLHPAEQPSRTQTDSRRASFVDGLAQALRSYELLTAGALVCFVLGRLLLRWPRAIGVALTMAASAALSAEECARSSFATTAGFALGLLAVALTAFVFSNSISRTAATQ